MLDLKYFVVHWGNGYLGLSDQLGVEPYLKMVRSFAAQPTCRDFGVVYESGWT